MDSGNSSSMQSSSGGEEEYESRPESVAGFLNTSGHFNPLSNPHPSLVSHSHTHRQQQHLPTYFDSSGSGSGSANYLNPYSQSQPNNLVLLNFDGIRPGGLRSDPSCTDLGSSSSSTRQSVLGAQEPSQGTQSRLGKANENENGLAQTDQPNTVVKNPKKRTRASRRAPTTVLTTDTTNFRAMVQEFTGIPAPPFSGPSYSRRLDLFGSGSGSGSGIRSSHLESIGSLYPLRPSAKRLQPNPLMVSSSSPSLLNSNPLIDAANNITNNTTSTIPTISLPATSESFNPSSSTSYQLPCDLGLLKQPQNLLSLQNQSHVLSFQSFLQPTSALDHPSDLNLTGFGVKPQGSSSTAVMPCLDEFGLTHAHVNNANLGLGGLQRSDTDWRSHGIGLNNQNQHPLHIGNYGNDDHSNSQRININSCKLNYSASSSDFHHEKRRENVSSRPEATIDSWICPAD